MLRPRFQIPGLAPFARTALLALLLLAGLGPVLLSLGAEPPASEPLPRPRRLDEPSRDNRSSNNKPASNQTAPRQPAVGWPAPAGVKYCSEPPAVAVTFLDVLRVAALANLDIAQARAVVEQVRAARLRAQVAILPNATAGANYVYHTGHIQRTEGNVINVNRDSLFVGGGPNLSFGLSEVLFGPAIAREVLFAAEAGQERVTNDTLLAVADAYFAVLRARRRIARIDETLDFLTSPERIDLRGNSPGLLPLIRAFVETGAALPSDLARVDVEIARRQEERSAALQDLRVAMSELARLLDQDPTVLLWPLEDYRIPLPLPGDAWAEQDIVVLVDEALRNRPELAEQRALVRAALGRLRTAQYRPLLPNAILSYNAGEFGGGPPVVGLTRTGGNVFGHSGQIANMGARTDFDVSVVWRLQNLGLGNLAEVREQRALHEQSIIRLELTADRVASQVVQAQEQVLRSRERVGMTRSSLYDQNGLPAGIVFRSVRLNFLRIRGGEGRPLEVLDSIRSLNDMLEAYGGDLTDYERARFRLLVALGLPTRALLDPRCMPVPPSPLRVGPPTPPPQPPAPSPPAAQAKPTRLPD